MTVSQTTSGDPFSADFSAEFGAGGGPASTPMSRGVMYSLQRILGRAAVLTKKPHPSPADRVEATRLINAVYATIGTYL